MRHGGAEVVVGEPAELVGTVVVDEDSEEDGESDLEEEFFPGVESIAGAGHASGGGEFPPVVPEPDAKEPDEADEAHLDVEGGEVGEEEGGGEDGGGDEDPAHGGGVSFVLHDLVEVGVVELGVVLDFLADEPTDGSFAEGHDDGEAEDDGEEGAELGVSEDGERAEEGGLVDPGT